jgi:hypothetical protein
MTIDEMSFVRTLLIDCSDNPIRFVNVHMSLEGILRSLKCSHFDYRESGKYRIYFDDEAFLHDVPINCVATHFMPTTLWSFGFENIRGSFFLLEIDQNGSPVDFNVDLTKFGVGLTNLVYDE